MVYTAHEAGLDRVLPDGSTERENLEFALERYSSVVARALLIDGPKCPDSFAYLLRHARKLVGRSGVSMEGLTPLTYLTVESYCRVEGWEFSPWEVEALLALDSVLRNPPPLYNPKKVKASGATPDATGVN